MRVAAKDFDAGNTFSLRCSAFWPKWQQPAYRGGK